MVIVSFILSFSGGILFGFFRLSNKSITLDIFGVLYLAILATFVVAIFIPNLAIQVRRIHDIGMSGWWVLTNNRKSPGSAGVTVDV